jgi:hypothetical protein
MCVCVSLYVCAGYLLYPTSLCSDGEPKTRKSDSGFSALLHFLEIEKDE